MNRLAILMLVLGIALPGYAQFFKDDKNVSKYDGYFNFYYDESKDRIYLEVERLDEEFLYVNALSEGLGSNDIGLDRGQLGDGVVVFFKKAGNKLLLVQPNQQYRAITDSAEEQQSVKEAFAKSILYGFEIEKEQKGNFLIDATDFLMRDAHGVAKRLADNDQGKYSLDKSRSAFNLERTKAFPKNVEFDVWLTFTGEPKGYSLRSVTPDASAVTVSQHHSFVALPDDNYRPRAYDPRSGSYPLKYLDYATPVTEPIEKRYIFRHRLEKKNPGSAVSEAIEPIVYYLDPGVPEPVRSALLEGASWWDQAFEAIGYKNAFQVKMLPKDADPLDLRYNVIQWVHRSTRGWSYGGSISDPRTGEILKGHVSLGSLRIRQDILIAKALQAAYGPDAIGDEFALEMALARIRQLSAHEVGHTLGFAHNFAASTNDRASVMDYPHPKLRLTNGKIDFSDAYATGIGDWDKVTVAYAYGDYGENEKPRLGRVLDEAFSQGLRYISDADARPAGSAHAYAHLWDNGNDPIAELENVLQIRKSAMSKFSVDNIQEGRPYSVLEDVFVPLYFFHRYQTEAVSKMIGGLDYSYAVNSPGQENEKDIVKMIDGKTERQAVDAVLKTLSVENLAVPKRLLGLFPPRAMGYNRTRESFKSKAGVAFDPFGATETAADMTLGFLFHPQRAARLVQHNSLDNSRLGLGELIETVIENTLKKEPTDDYHNALQQVINSQVLNHLFALSANRSNYIQTTAIVNEALGDIKTWLKQQGDKAVFKEYLTMIAAFEKDPEKFEPIAAPKIPDGSPIGTVNR